MVLYRLSSIAYPRMQAPGTAMQEDLLHKKAYILGGYSSEAFLAVGPGAACAFRRLAG